MNRVQGKQGKSEEDENLSESGKQKEPELKLETEVKTVSSVDKDSETPSILKGEDASSPSALKKTEELRMVISAIISLIMVQKEKELNLVLIRMATAM